jgi:hypothetical protein
MTLIEHITRTVAAVDCGQLSARGLALLIEALCAMAKAQGRAEGVAEVQAVVLGELAIAKARHHE